MIDIPAIFFYFFSFSLFLERRRISMPRELIILQITMKILKERLLMKMLGTRQKGTDEWNYSIHAPFQSPSAWYAPFLVANFSLSSLICALPTFRHGLRFDFASLMFATFHEFLAFDIFDLHAGNWENLWRIVIFYRFLIIRGRHAFFSPRTLQFAEMKWISSQVHCWPM